MNYILNRVVNSSWNYAKFSSRSLSVKRIFFSTKTLENVENKENPDKLEKFIDKLQTDLSANKRINANHLKETLKSIPENNLTSRQLQVLLEALTFLPNKTKTDRLELLNEIWKQGSASIKLADTHYLKLIQIYKENKFAIQDYEKFIQELGFEAGTNVYYALLDLTCELGDLDNAKLLIEKMKDRRWPIEEELFSSLIRCHSRQKNLLKVHEILDTMSAGNIEITTKTYCELIRAYIENDKIDWAKKYIQDKGMLFSEIKLLSILESLIYYNTDRSLLTEILGFFPKDCIKNPQIDPLFRNFFVGLIYSGRTDDVIEILTHLPVQEFKLNENHDAYASLLINDLIASCQSFETVMKFCNFLISTNRNPRALHVAIESALHRDSPLILDLLKELSKTEELRTHYFWPLFVSHSKHAGEAGVLNVVKIMQKDFKVTADYETINQYILPRLSITLKDPKQTIKMLDDQGLTASTVLSPLISHFLYQKRMSDVESLLKSYSAIRLDTEMFIWPLTMLISSSRSERQLLNIAKLIKTFNDRALDTNYDLGGHLLMEVLANNKIKDNTKLVQNLMKEFTLVDVRISTATKDLLKQQFANDEVNENLLKNLTDKKLHIPSVELFDSPQSITHPRDMTLEELECHLVELESKNLNTRGILRRLLQLCVRENKLERAVEIKRKCEEQKVEISPGMLASIFDLHIKTKNPAAAEETYRNIRKSYPGFLLDEHKIVDFATVLVENDQVTRAMEVLKERQNARQIQGGQNLQKNVWNLLTAVGNHAQQMQVDKNESKEFYNYLKDSNYTSNPTNTTFGPIIREYLEKNQVKSAVLEYIDICKKTRKTPLQLEIVRTLIEHSNKNAGESTALEPKEAQEFLQEVLELSASIHGTPNTNSMMVIATAEAGTENQLRKLLMDQNIKVMPEYLLKQCEYLSDNGKIDVLLKLGRTMRGLEHHLKVNEIELYNLVLNVLARKNDVQGAISLFENIVNEGNFRVTPEFTRNVISLLERNKLEVPTSIAIYAK